MRLYRGRTLSKRSIANEQPAKGKQPRKAAAGQKEMLLPISGKKPGKVAVKKAAKSQRRSA
jgi:DNA end-binding protein Ku